MGCQHTGKQIGQALGRLIPIVDSEDEVSWGDFVRIRVALNISKPLCRGKKIDLEGGKEVLVSFKYERLANFCYWCGLVTHSDKDCSIWLRSKETLNPDNQQYGAWMRAQARAHSDRKPSRLTDLYLVTIVQKANQQSLKHHHSQT